MVVSSDSTSETPQVHTMAFRLIDRGPATSVQILLSSDTNVQIEPIKMECELMKQHWHYE